MEQREIKIITFGTCEADNLDTEERQAFFGTLLQGFPKCLAACRNFCRKCFK